jgi:hypothetical protein
MQVALQSLVILFFGNVPKKEYIKKKETEVVSISNRHLKKDTYFISHHRRRR